MPVTATSAEEMFVGAGDVYVDDVAVGATLDSNVFRVVREYLDADNVNGVRGPIIGLDYVVRETAELEVSVPEISADRLAYAVPGAVSTTQSSTPTDTGGGGNTLTSAAATAGATNIKVDAVTNFAIGDLIRIGTGSTREYHRVETVGTAGAGGTGIDIEHPLKFAQGLGVAFVEIDGTLLAADSAAGADNIKVVSVTGLVADDFVWVGVQGDAEIRKIQNVGTAGAGGTGLDLYVALDRAHRADDYVIEVTNEGETTIESGTSRRIPTTAYHKWELRVPGLDGREARFTLKKALMTENAEMEATDDGILAPRLTLQARWDPATPNTSPWTITRVPKP